MLDDEVSGEICAVAVLTDKDGEVSDIDMNGCYLLGVPNKSALSFSIALVYEKQFL